MRLHLITHIPPKGLLHKILSQARKHHGMSLWQEVHTRIVRKVSDHWWRCSGGELRLDLLRQPRIHVTCVYGIDKDS